MQGYKILGKRLKVEFKKGEGDGKEDKEEEKATGDDERLIGYLRAISAKSDFDLALGLHTCGLLADAVLALAKARRSRVCLVPCCYGQVATLKEDHRRGVGTEQRMHPCSEAMRKTISSEHFAWCAKAADFTPGKGGVFDVNSEGFQTAWRCMRIVDSDRLLFAREDRSGGKVETS
eukprot:g1520.t1